MAEPLDEMWSILATARYHLGNNNPVLADRQIQKAQGLLGTIHTFASSAQEGSQNTSHDALTVEN